MKTFAAIVTKHKAAKHRIPAGQGWKTRQQVARELGVNARDLRGHLADALAAKDIEEKKFTEWDAAAMKAVPVTCYRIVEKPEPKSSATKPGKPADELTAAILACHQRHPHSLPLRDYFDSQHLPPSHLFPHYLRFRRFLPLLHYLRRHREMYSQAQKRSYLDFRRSQQTQLTQHYPQIQTAQHLPPF